jgi:hypothetical protein
MRVVMRKFIHIYIVVFYASLLLVGPAAIAQKNAGRVSAVGSVQPDDKADGPQMFFQGNAEASQGKMHPLLTQEELDLRLFDEASLKMAHTQLMAMRSFFAQYQAEDFWKLCIPALFDDRMQAGTRLCYPASKLLQELPPLNPRTNCNALIVELIGREGYEELSFCLSYRGISYTDPELWQLYFDKNRKLLADLLKLENMPKRLIYYLLALDIEQKMCLAADGGFRLTM